MDEASGLAGARDFRLLTFITLAMVLLLRTRRAQPAE